MIGAKWRWDAQKLGGKLVVTDVEDGSPSEDAGLEAGDAVLTINGTSVGSTGAARQLVSAAVGQLDFTVKRRRAANDMVQHEKLIIERPAPDSSIGVTWKIRKEDRALVVATVDDSSPSAKGGLRVGDLVVFINGQEALSLAAAKRSMGTALRIEVVVERLGSNQSVPVQNIPSSLPVDVLGLLQGLGMEQTTEEAVLRRAAAWCPIDVILTRHSTSHPSTAVTDSDP